MSIYYDRFYLKLGNECNFSCKYCSQGQIPRENKSHKISQDVLDFLDNYLIDHKDKPKTILRLWGGEPLLYFDTMKELIARYKGKFEFTCISNGSLLNQEIVDFMNENNIMFALSHDGSVTEATRNIDILKNKEIKSLFDSIKNRSILSLITSENPYIHKVYDYYKNLGYYDLFNISIVWMVNHNGTDNQKKLSEINIEKYKEGYRELISRYEKHKNSTGYYPQEFSIVRGKLQNIISKINIKKSELKNRKYIRKCSTCGYYGKGLKLEFDIHGNVYNCHNSDDIIGHITEDTKTLERKKEKNLDNIKKEINCQDCIFQNICEGVCMKTVPEGDIQWCKLYQATITVLLEYIDTKDLEELLRDLK